MTAWSIDSVSGVGAPLSITVKVRSYTNSALHSGGKFEDTAIGAARRGQHEPDRHFAFALRRQRDGAAVDHVDQRAIAQATQVLRGERLVVCEIGDTGWRVGG